MMRLNHFGCVLAAGALALGALACGDRRGDVAGPGGAVQIRLRGAVTGGATEAYAKVDAAHVTVSVANAALLDTTVAFAAASQPDVTLSVQLADPSGTVAVSVDLVGSGAVLFHGGGSAELRRGTTTSVPVTVAPVVAAVTAPDSVALTAIGDVVRLRAAAVFASGDTVVSPAGSWAGDGGTVFTVTADGLVTASREGVGQATVSYQGKTHVTRVRVQAAVASVVVSPSTASLTIGGTQTFTAVASDRNGNALQRTIAWASSNTGVATVDQGGLVTAVAPGSATISASSEGRTGTATVTVAQPLVGVSPTQVSFSLIQGDPASSQTVSVVNAGGGTLSGLSATVSSGGSGWLSASLASTTAPTTLTLTADPGSLAIGTYSATVTVASNIPGAGSVPVAVTVTVQPRVQPIVGVTRSSLSLQTFSTMGSATDSLTVFNAGNGTLTGITMTTTYPVGAPSGWLSVSPTASASAPFLLWVTASAYNPAGPYLGYGTYYATVVVSSSVPGAGSRSVAVTFNVTQPPILTVTPTSLSIAGTDTTSKTITITNTGTGTITGISAGAITYSCTSPTAGCPTGWLTMTAPGSTAPTSMTVRHGFMATSGNNATARFTISSSAGSQQVTVTVP